GGDRLGTVNLSTMSSLVAVGAGAKIVKHGNRGSSSTAGAADVIEALGVDLNLTQSRAKRSLEEAGITFLFAQEYHPSMRFVAPARKQLGVPTALTIWGHYQTLRGPRPRRLVVRLKRWHPYLQVSWLTGECGVEYFAALTAGTKSIPEKPQSYLRFVTAE